MGEIIVALTGASGALYGLRLIEVLSNLGKSMRVIVTDSAKLTLSHECNYDVSSLKSIEHVTLEDNSDIAAKSASGSAKIDAMVIVPCSGTTLGKLASGIGDNLVTRSAIVAMKERRKLIIVPRETPLATVHIENMLKLSSWDTVILPASPGFYHNPNSIDDLVDFIVSRILDQLGIDNNLSKRWTGEEI